MTAAKKLNLTSVQDYLAGELNSPNKHEYLGGVVYAMAGARNAHNRIATNLIVAVGSRLRDRSCEVFNSDTKIRVQMPAHIRFYYPDASIVCRPNPDAESFQDEPVVLFEVLSSKTRRIDEGEKKDAYLTIPSLCVYALVDPDCAKIVAFRRADRVFVPEVYEGLDSVLPLGEVEIDLPLRELYANVQFVPETDADAD